MAESGSWAIMPLSLKVGPSTRLRASQSGFRGYILPVSGIGERREIANMGTVTAEGVEVGDIEIKGAGALDDRQVLIAVIEALDEQVSWIGFCSIANPPCTKAS
jgi:hypothetical protein